MDSLVYMKKKTGSKYEGLIMKRFSCT